jgi:hypothetical protein
VSRLQFETVAEHNDWTPRDTDAYLIVAFNELAAHTLHGALTRAIYEGVTAAFGNRYGDHHLEEAFNAQLKRRTQHVWNPCRSFPSS